MRRWIIVWSLGFLVVACDEGISTPAPDTAPQSDVARDTGEGLWSFKTRRKVDASPLIAGDAVVFGSGDGRMYVVDLASGEERWTYDIGEAVISSPAVVDGRIYIGANDGNLYVFGAKGPEEGGSDR